jgi:hypothetical protein
MAGDDTPRTEAGHPWDKHDDSCDCHIGICGDCGCTNEYSEASATPPSTEGLDEAYRWIVRKDDERHVSDNACAECVPEGPILIDGFRCVPHKARAHLGYGSFARLRSTQGET